jgi:prepilin-type N-terminal cleavage/methylation domain-containing protein
MKKMNKLQNGFTIIELLIATTIFTFFLFLFSSMIIRIGQLYTKGIISSRTQEASRSIVTEIGRAIQFSGGTPSWDATHVCAGNESYTFTLGKQLNESGAFTYPDQISHVLVASQSGCGAPTSGPQRELMGENMRLSNLTVSGSALTGLYTIKVRVVYGDAPFLNFPNATNAECKNGDQGPEFCAASEFTVTVQKRL